jgi:hypothetical protein
MNSHDAVLPNPAKLPRLRIHGDTLGERQQPYPLRRLLCMSQVYSVHVVHLY